MFSSFWSSGLAFADVVCEQFKAGNKVSWLIATLPALVLAVLLPLGILDFVQIGAGALSIILVIVVLPAYYHAVKCANDTILPPKFAKSKLFLYAVGLFVVLMAISSLISVN